MKKILLLLLVFAGHFASADSVKTAEETSSSLLSTPETLYVLIMLFATVAFFFGIIYSLGRANRIMTNHLKDNL